MSDGGAIAVLMGMRADASSDLAHAALQSTLEGLCDEDQIFLMIDGACYLENEPLRVLCQDARISLFFSQCRRGLAAGLNELIDAVLTDKKFLYLARMDADDESLTARFRKQRKFLSNHPEVDIVGGLCHEVDSQGRRIRTKQVPVSHEAIVSHLPKRNALNHPTVMMRRRVFSDGLRYRTDVGLVEDWHLWIDAAAQGFRLANLNEVVLNFRRSEDFVVKRGGVRQALAEWNVRKHARKSLGLGNPGNIVFAVVASLVRLAPPSLQNLAYRLAD